MKDRAVKKWRVTQKIKGSGSYEKIMSTGDILNMLFDSDDEGDKGDIMLEVLCGNCFEIVHDENTLVHFCCCNRRGG